MSRQKKYRWLKHDDKPINGLCTTRRMSDEELGIGAELLTLREAIQQRGIKVSTRDLIAIGGLLFTAEKEQRILAEAKPKRDQPRRFANTPAFAEILDDYFSQLAH